ncbi:UNVERIFIED_ORG: hypothetical protein HNP28_002820 [Comamonas terrigena]
MSEGRPVADLSTITCIEDLGVISKRRVLRRCYGYADSGSYTQGTYRANEEAFQQSKLRQRVAVNMQGHTDDTGPAVCNQPLSERRAQRAARGRPDGAWWHAAPAQVNPRGWGHSKLLPRVQGAGCRVQGAGCRVQGAGCAA